MRINAAAKPITRQSISGVAPTGNAAGTSRASSRRAESCERHSGDSSRQRDHETLSEQLPQQPEASRTHRDAHRHLLLAHQRSREQEIREVGAGNQQQTEGSAEDRHDQQARLRRDQFADRHHTDARPGVVLRIRTLQTRGHDVHVRPGLRE